MYRHDGKLLALLGPKSNPNVYPFFCLIEKSFATVASAMACGTFCGWNSALILRYTWLVLDKRTDFIRVSSKYVRVNEGTLKLKKKKHFWAGICSKKKNGKYVIRSLHLSTLFRLFRPLPWTRISYIKKETKARWYSRSRVSSYEKVIDECERKYLAKIAIRLALEEVVDVGDAGRPEAFHFFGLYFLVVLIPSHKVSHRGERDGGPSRRV